MALARRYWAKILVIPSGGMPPRNLSTWVPMPPAASTMSGS